MGRFYYKNVLENKKHYLQTTKFMLYLEGDLSISFLRRIFYEIKIKYVY